MQSTAIALGRYGKHTPRILRRQLIHQLTEHYQHHNDSFNNDTDNAKDNCCVPSIQRFHAALLFVDISGFTALSLRLSVEELKNHINDYFTKMLDIVDKHGGDVI
jgi:class 3 adenylate cyclase